MRTYAEHLALLVNAEQRISSVYPTSPDGPAPAGCLVDWHLPQGETYGLDVHYIAVVQGHAPDLPTGEPVYLLTVGDGTTGPTVAVAGRYVTPLAEIL